MRGTRRPSDYAAAEAAVTAARSTETTDQTAVHDAEAALAALTSGRTTT